MKSCFLPGCKRPGYAFWQPIPWQDGNVPLGPAAKEFHSEHRGIPVHVPVPGDSLSPAGGAREQPAELSLWKRTFETCKNTESAPPSRAFEEAALYRREHPALPLAYCMAATCDGAEPLLLMLAAADGQAFIQQAAGEAAPLYLKLGVDRLLPKLQFVYDHLTLPPERRRGHAPDHATNGHHQLRGSGGGRAVGGGQAHVRPVGRARARAVPVLSAHLPGGAGTDHELCGPPGARYPGPGLARGLLHRPGRVPPAAVRTSCPSCMRATTTCATSTRRAASGAAASVDGGPGLGDGCFRSTSRSLASGWSST